MNDIIKRGPDPLKVFVNTASVKAKLNELLGNRAGKFATALVAIQRGSYQLQNCTNESILGAATSAAALDLEIDPNLGQAYLVPYGELCSFQIGYKGLVQLAQRTGKYLTLGFAIVYEGQLEYYDVLDGDLKYNPTAKKSDTVIGYAAKFTLLNGFRKAVFWTKEACMAHGQRFSKSFGKKDKKGNDSSPWQTSPDAMCLKTVLRDLLLHWGPMSVQMSDALSLDTKVFRDADPSNALPESSIDIESLPAAKDSSEMSTAQENGPVAPTENNLSKVLEGCPFDMFREFAAAEFEKVCPDLSSCAHYSEVPADFAKLFLQDVEKCKSFIGVFGKKGSK